MTSDVQPLNSAMQEKFGTPAAVEIRVLCIHGVGKSVGLPRLDQFKGGLCGYRPKG